MPQSRGNQRFGILRGDRHGCYMLPILFNLYEEHLMKESLVKVGDFKIRARIIKIKFTDDTSIIAKNAEELRKCGMEINIDKTQVMRVSWRNESLQIKVGNRELKGFDHVKYFGNVSTRDGHCTRKIKNCHCQKRI